MKWINARAEQPLRAATIQHFANIVDVGTGCAMKRNFTFHDLRHCAINNLRLVGNDHFVIKRASGHKTDSAFQCYNLVTEEEMKGMKWLDEKEEKSGTMDTYMDTMLKLKRT